MPTYEYECQGCEKCFEIFQSMKDDPIKKCPECGSRKFKRLIGAGAGFLFKGSGFYITDYRSEEYKKKAKAETSGSSADSSSKKEPASKKKTDSAKSSGGGEKKKPTQAA